MMKIKFFIIAAATAAGVLIAAGVVKSGGLFVLYAHSQPQDDGKRPRPQPGSVKVIFLTENDTCGLPGGGG